MTVFTTLPVSLPQPAAANTFIPIACGVIYSCGKKDCCKKYKKPGKKRCKDCPKR